MTPLAVSASLIALGGLAWFWRDARRARLWKVGTPGWWKPAPGTAYDKFGNTEAR